MITIDDRNDDGHEMELSFEDAQGGARPGPEYPDTTSH